MLTIFLSIASCSDDSTSNVSWDEMNPDQKANRLDSKMANGLNFLDNKIDELEQENKRLKYKMDDLETRIRALENIR
jgi:peptidoglycan hydrolase CwlO-like protein